MRKILYYSDLTNPCIDWVFEFFSTSIGCAFHRTPERHLASIVYSTQSTDSTQFHIPVWNEYYDKNAEHCLNRGHYWVPVGMQDTNLFIDYVGFVFRLLNLFDELVIPSTDRDSLGNLLIKVHPRRMEFLDRPMVDEVLQIFKQKLVEYGLLRDNELLPRWPGGKRYAVLITHDTDGPCLLEPKELAKAGVKGFLKLNGKERAAFFEGCRRILTGLPDPYFNFAPWAEFEQSLNVKSAFYIYVHNNRVPGHFHNPVYRLSTSQTKWNILHELSELGWEIGLHASIHALEEDSYIQAEKNDLENFLGKSIAGNRCHYWHINWRMPEESFRRLERAGIAYDCSIAWRGEVGFRSATTVPYHPYDSQNSRGFTLLEIPTNVMDGHLFHYQPVSDPNRRFATILEQVRAHGGILNLDWHTCTWVDDFSHKGVRSFLVQELQEIVSTGEAWFTTPEEIANYWQKRAQHLHQNALSANAISLSDN